MSFVLKSDNKIRRISLKNIQRSPTQPRKIFDEDNIMELSKSISENGIIQPVVVRRVGKIFEIVAGERRVRAAVFAGFESVPCIIMDCDDDKAAVLSLLENIQRQNLDPFEEALAIKSILDKEEIKQEEIAKKLGKSQSAIANKLRLLKLSEDEVDKIREAKLTERHSRAFIRIKDKDTRLKVINMVIQKKLNVEQTEKLIEKQLSNDDKKPKNKILIKDVRIFINTISKAVKTMKSSGINAETVKNETDDYIECIIKIPKVNTK